MAAAVYVSWPETGAGRAVQSTACHAQPGLLHQVAWSVLQLGTVPAESFRLAVCVHAGMHPWLRRSPALASLQEVAQVLKELSRQAASGARISLRVSRPEFHSNNAMACPVADATQAGSQAVQMHITGLSKVGAAAWNVMPAHWLLPWCMPRDASPRMCPKRRYGYGDGSVLAGHYAYSECLSGRLVTVTVPPPFEWHFGCPPAAHLLPGMSSLQGRSACSLHLQAACVWLQQAHSCPRLCAHLQCWLLPADCCPQQMLLYAPY